MRSARISAQCRRRDRGRRFHFGEKVGDDLTYRGTPTCVSPRGSLQSTPFQRFQQRKAFICPPRISALAVVFEHRCRLRQPAPEVRGFFTANGAQRSLIPVEVRNLPGLGPPDHRVTVSGRISRNSAEIRSPDATPTIARPPFSKSNLPPTDGNVGLPHRRPADFWKRKLAAFLHDTPTKCLTIREHQEKSHIAMSRAGFTAEEIGCYDYEADWAAAAADRYPFPTRPRLRSLLRLRRPPQPVPPPIWRCEGNSRSSARLHPHRQ